MEISTFTLSSFLPIPHSPNFLPFSSSSSLFSKPRTGFSLNLTRTGSRNQKPKKGLSCNCLFGLGVPEIVVIAGVAALLFGPKNLPDVGKSIGKSVKSFQQAAKEFETELKKEPESRPDSTPEVPTPTNEGAIK